MADIERIHVTFTSDVPQAARDYVLDMLASMDGATLGERRLYAYRQPSSVLSDTVQIDITGHDRTTFDLTDGQVIERLRLSAKAQGISVIEMLRRLAQDS